jgi:hypothetical protein
MVTSTSGRSGRRQQRTRVNEEADNGDAWCTVKEEVQVNVCVRRDSEVAVYHPLHTHTQSTSAAHTHGTHSTSHYTRSLFSRRTREAIIVARGVLLVQAVLYTSTAITLYSRLVSAALALSPDAFGDAAESVPVHIHQIRQ